VSVLAPAVPDSARALLRAVVDYAGLFPPTSATMGDAVAHYASERAGADQWMLGRFVLPAARLAEFKAVHAPFAGEPAWGLSAVVGDLDAELPGIVAFNAHARGAIVDAMEVKASTVADIERVAAHRLPGVDVYVEVPLAGPEPLLRVVAAHGFFGKARTGGVTADGIPPARALAEFLAAAVGLGLAFKCTAGLHHPLRGDYPLTYASDAPHGTMFGYLNVLLATAAIRRGWPPAVVDALLEERDETTVSFGAAGVTWRGKVIGIGALEAARAASLRSFGSCSFRDPVDELAPIARGRG
jgi:hypothetical protein